MATLAGVDKLDLSLALPGLVFVDDPDVGGNAGIVEGVVGKLYDGIQPVIFNQIAANLTLTAPRIAGEQRRTVLNDGHSSGIFQLFYAVHQKQHLTVTLAGQARSKATRFTFFMLRLHHGGFALPVDTKGRVGNHEVKLIAGKFIIGQGVAKLHIVRVTTVESWYPLLQFPW